MWPLCRDMRKPAAQLRRQRQRERPHGIRAGLRASPRYAWRACAFAAPEGSYSRPVPCPNGPGRITVSTLELPDGTQPLAVQAQTQEPRACRGSRMELVGLEPTTSWVRYGMRLCVSGGVIGLRERNPARLAALLGSVDSRGLPGITFHLGTGKGLVPINLSGRTVLAQEAGAGARARIPGLGHDLTGRGQCAPPLDAGLQVIRARGVR